jgi:hypothetical protein
MRERERERKSILNVKGGNQIGINLIQTKE